MSAPAQKTLEQTKGKVNNLVPEKELAELMGRVKSVSEMPKSSVLMLFSNPGVGKTTTAAMIGHKTILITNETGYETLENYPEVYARTQVIPFDVDTGVKDCLRIMRARYFGQIDCDCIVLDTLSGISERMVHKSLVTNTGPLFVRASPDVPGIADYGWAFQQIRPVLLAAADLATRGCTVIFNCHVRYPSEQDVAKGDILNRPDMQKAIYYLANESSGVVGYIYTDKRSNARMVRTQSDSTENKFAVKQRKRLPPVMPVQDFIDFFSTTK